jgi:multiple sugar transport system ATP-binding protein
VTLGLRPNDLHPDENGALHAEIRAIEQLGSESYLYGHFADGTPLTVHNPGQTNLQPGERVTLTENPARIHLFDTETTRTLRM